MGRIVRIERSRLLARDVTQMLAKIFARSYSSALVNPRSAVTS
jgi:hypothetical protein